MAAMKHLLATAAVLALTSVSAIGAERYQPKETVIAPPAEYDKPFVGKLEEFIINDRKELKDLCWGRLGCAIRRLTTSEISGLVYDCRIYLPAEELIREYGWTFEIIRRHEIAHCNGWVHPPDLPNIDPWSLKVSKPE
jgi:hypothetical protein